MIKKVDKQGFDKALQTAGKTVVINFSTDWCPYCKRLEPVIGKVADENKDTIDVYYVNIDECPDLAEQYDIMTVPTVYAFINGEVKGHAVNPQTQAALIKLIF